MCFLGVCECISVFILGLKWISGSVTRPMLIDVISFWFGSRFCRVLDVVIKAQHKQIHGQMSWMYIDLHSLLEIHWQKEAAVWPLSPLSNAKIHNLLVSHWPLNFSVAPMPAAAKVMAKDGSTGFVPDVILFSAAHGNPPPTQQSQTNDFDLSSAVRGRSYRYNPANDVKDLSAKLMNDKNSPPPSTPSLPLLT